MDDKNKIYKSVDVYEGFDRWINEKGVQREKNYNWFCPKCRWYNVDENKLDIVECENCGGEFKANNL